MLNNEHILLLPDAFNYVMSSLGMTRPQYFVAHTQGFGFSLSVSFHCVHKTLIMLLGLLFKQMNSVCYYVNIRFRQTSDYFLTVCIVNWTVLLCEGETLDCV